MLSSICRIAPFVALLALAASLQPSGARAHSLPNDEQAAELEASPDRLERIHRMSRLESYRMAPGLRQRALFKINNSRLEAAGLSPSERARALSRGPMRAFPFIAQPELGSVGTKHTVTLLVDFPDVSAATLHPGVSADRVSANIYGSGTDIAKNSFPFESLHNYYRRASENKLDIAGDVLGWVRLAKNRSKYEPVYPAGVTEEEKANIDNKALFDLVSEALDKMDATTDFAQYDNDNDGDIDLITILYAGPHKEWGEFWWAYQWKFFVPAAFSKTYDGKRLKQFIFSFVETRQGNDFEPNTLVHEYGHALGLPDLYDYCSSKRFAKKDCPSWVTKPGPDGGIGGLDIMDGNKGNHNALNRWLLDWIEPKVIASGGESNIRLEASGAGTTGIKAIAMFPGLQQSNTPDRELFLIENRSRVGNDGGTSEMPSNGLVIWHVDASPSTDNSDFSFDNSFSQRKLIRLMRAQSDADFKPDAWANALDYYVPGSRFGPDTVPSSDSYDGQHTGVSLSDIVVVSQNIATAKVGYTTSPEPMAVAAAEPSSETASATPMATKRSITRMMRSAPSPAIDLAELQRLNEEFRTLKADELAKLWQENAGGIDLGGADSEQTLLGQLLLTHWAGKDGLAATTALLALPRSDFSRRMFPDVMTAWSYNDPQGANDWYFASAQDALRKDASMVAGETFTNILFRWRGLSDPKTAAIAIDKLDKSQEIFGAVEGLRGAAATTNSDGSAVESKLESLGPNSGKARSVLKLQDALKDTTQEFQQKPDSGQVDDLLRQRLP